MFETDSKKIKLGLDRISRLMRKLGNPHIDFPAIHIAGTNGKGSVAAILAAILEEAGYKVGLYTSPHLIKFNERMKINGKEISDKELKLLKIKVEEEQQRIELTAFEKLTAIAFLHFSKKNIDIGIVETGLGGRLDATNITEPIISIITNIGIDHIEFLGKDETSITREKAGIIKKDVPVIIGEVKRKISKVIEAIARKKSAPIYFIKKLGKSPSGLNLKGEFQKENYALVLKALELLGGRGYQIPKKAITSGIKNVRWPGRLQIVSYSPKIILDGAHNTMGAQALRESLKKMFKGEKFTLIFNALKTKDIDGMLRELMPIVNRIIFTRSSHPLSLSPKEFKEKSSSMNIKDPFIEEDNEKSLNLAKKLSDPILITGSLFLVGDCLRILKN